jgi:hypothetical protein
MPGAKHFEDKMLRPYCFVILASFEWLTKVFLIDA